MSTEDNGMAGVGIITRGLVVTTPCTGTPSIARVTVRLSKYSTLGARPVYLGIFNVNPANNNPVNYPNGYLGRVQIPSASITEDPDYG